MRLTLVVPDAHLIVRHSTENAVLLQDGALPVVPTADVLVAGERLGLPLTVVRTQHRDGGTRVIACQLLDDAALPDGASWADERAARRVPRYASAVGAWFDEELGRVPTSRPPWLRHDWLSGTLAWVDDLLADAGRVRTGTPKQLRHWGLSAVLRVPANGGDVVVKETLPLYRNEPSVLRWLHALDPVAVPRLVRHDAAQHRWVLEAFDPQEHDAEPGALVALAGLQRLAAGKLAGLRAIGCPERPLSRLASDLAALAQRDDILFATDRNLQSTDGRLPPRNFTSADRDALAAALPHIAVRVERLASLGIPDTIVHGDFHIHNVAWTGERYVLFDWANAAIGHPFMDLPMWLQWATDPDASVDAYLRSWGGPDLVGIWDDVHPVALLHHALTLLPLVDVEAAGESAPEWAAGVQKRVLQALDLLAK